MNQNKYYSKNGGLSAAFYTLGCRVNQYETQAIKEQFQKYGYQIKSFDEECDVYVINTCTVTSESDRKSRQIIRRAISAKKNTSIIVVCGCYAQGNSESVKKIDGVDIILGNARKTEICKLATEYLYNKSERVLVTNISQVNTYEETEISFSERTRAFVKIVDGCENHCTYCIIPKVRGKIRSRTPENIINEVRKLANAGYKEIVLTGIETAAYGKDFQNFDDPLASLIENVACIEGIERIRLGSMEPTIFNERFVKRIAKIPKLMPHYHLSLQSGSNEILKLMKRKYNTEQFISIIECLRKYIPDVQITTDIIVGFPGETDELFNETIDFIKKCAFSYIHIFPFSKRAGTPASTMPFQIDGNIKKERVCKLEKVMRNIRKSIISKFVGTNANVLLETCDNSFIDGYTQNYVKVKIPYKDAFSNLEGKIISVEITGLIDDSDENVCLLGNI